MSETLDAIRAFNGQQGPRCSVGVFLEQHPALAETVSAALDDPTIQTRAVCKWLRETHHIVIGYDALRRHNRGDCNCE